MCWTNLVAFVRDCFYLSFQFEWAGRIKTHLSFTNVNCREGYRKKEAISSIFDKCSILEQTIWPSNHTSHTKVYFNEFVSNALHENIGIVNFDL